MKIKDISEEIYPLFEKIRRRKIQVGEERLNREIRNRNSALLNDSSLKIAPHIFDFRLNDKDYFIITHIDIPKNISKKKYVSVTFDVYKKENGHVENQNNLSESIRLNIGDSVYRLKNTDSQLNKIKVLEENISLRYCFNKFFIDLIRKIDEKNYFPSNKLKDVKLEGIINESPIEIKINIYSATVKFFKNDLFGPRLNTYFFSDTIVDSKPVDLICMDIPVFERSFYKNIASKDEKQITDELMKYNKITYILDYILIPTAIERINKILTYNNRRFSRH